MSRLCGQVSRLKRWKKFLAKDNKADFCKYGCQTPIKLKDSQVSIRGLKIPLNLDGTAHDCANRPYNKRRKPQQQISKAATTWNVKPCKYCGQSITFNDSVTAPSGKKIPLNIDGSHHECPRNPFNIARQQGGWWC